MLRRRLALACLLLPALPAGAQQQRFVPQPLAESPALLGRLRQGGLVLFFRHADTSGEPCDRSFRLGDRDGQRNLSQVGRQQARRIGAALAEAKIPIADPILAGPVFRARDTAELAFGARRVMVTEALLADDYSAGRLDQLVLEHRRLFSAAPPPGANRVLVGHRTPAIMAVGEAIAGQAFPEGAALVIEPRGSGPDAWDYQVLGIVMPAPIPGGGFHRCQ